MGPAKPGIQEQFLQLPVAGNQPGRVADSGADTVHRTVHLQVAEVAWRADGMRLVEGQLDIDVGFTTYHLEPGDSIAFDSSVPHEYLNKTGDYVHAVWVVVHSEPGRA